MKKIDEYPDNELPPFIRSEISRSSLNSYNRNKSLNKINIPIINLFASFCYFTNEKIAEEEILQSPLVKSIKKSKILLDKSFNFDDHYSDMLD